MAPKRRTAGAATKSQQSTLAFHGSSNRVTKSGVKAQGANKGNFEKTVKDATPDVLETSSSERRRAEAVIVEQAQPVESTADEDQARRISEAAIRKYWAAKEKQRQASRVHQEGLSVEDKILREFDMSAHYGPSAGIARLKRWKRAQRLGLEPPLEVLGVLLREQAQEDRDRGGIKVQRSIVDELLNSRAEVAA
ncbi:hypothetical protein ACJQWK_08485 [Exserohilum turcicum]|uniref:DNA polymerase delta subunit 4 n=1 Tax=Exserohilum turcicum (strain 28A) TaxID=671987 RepID=R0K1L0_EXST2|nr:uncharacterized protein SETTUDRAFT_163101 [Exserohilum turcica Et28A]EOA87028.1 hypothetical protein SETTUDRAFT_163101 [Exserohilum turcica Et28A]